ncbi:MULTISPECIES: riboflavin biosynthesis protein RibF [Lacticaseibacillus]|uniref:Riboflavin biosynthesis protein n=1 Tax=Lacticaseibacillus casei DSM 20011 = JCM 1134 = ATCC 393 TaxID=1423732 RepID=A0AAD1APN4_LACCA|nr:riboflavin biosynthesis protein RibF [Lacticaseibacillus casei]HAJ55470.1 riboflavin biosynthesis protein RibF [Lactobacillus sp.]MBI6596623.1 riboflavin biosynthesis protein RibF [Lacticaseibacillus casei]MBO1480398.1 riboflavin biosynthesis protein RibF [Lacticaseibacillus casei]MBO2415593.1 riboflavin biosynthesis protein RibF [Lacticaseibacillus casei]MCK2079952.1 riboflavin biosynthesis protein RibF [Lacticaseibacillus casei]
MEVIDIHPPLQASAAPPQPIVLTLGFFDGVHRGHQAVIKAGKQIALAQKLPLAVMTFDIHPAVVYRGVSKTTIQYLSTRDEKIDLMRQLGVDLLYFVHFTPEFAALSPQAFVDQYLVGLKADTVVAGFDYTYGKRAIANMALLPDYAHGRFEVVSVPKLAEDGAKVSSTRIRDALDQGDIDTANELLGYAYLTTGKVVHGEARGRELGFPTINLATLGQQWLPGIGIYAVTVNVDGTWYLGMASIGRNVTFGSDRDVTLEINLLDFSRMIYGKTVQVRWYHYLRGEVKFANAEGLITQLKKDETAVRQYFARKG